MAQGPIGFFESYARMTAREKGGHWDEEYAKGKWRFMDSMDEMPRHAITAGLLSAFKSPDLVDVGCGLGSLLRFIGHNGFRSYRGIDVAAEAIKKASLLKIPNAVFEVMDLEELTLDSPVDAIVFNESLYYARDPVQTLARLTPGLKPRGLFVVSMWAPPEEPEFDEYRSRSQEIWRSVEPQLAVVHDIAAQTLNHRWDRGQTRAIDYRIKALRPKT